MTTRRDSTSSSTQIWSVESDTEVGPPYFCVKCDYRTDHERRFLAHTRTKKHLRNTGQLEPAPSTYTCELCDYNTAVKGRLRVHHNTIKHRRAAGMLEVPTIQQDQDLYDKLRNPKIIVKITPRALDSQTN